MTKALDLTIVRGSTFSLVVLPEAPPIIYKAITAALQTAPLRLTVPGHGLVSGRKVAITNMKGMTEANAVANEVRESDRRPCTVIDPNTIEINAINAAGFRPYISGGILQYNTPLDLTGYIARMSITDKLDGTELFRLDTLNGRITVNTTDGTLTLTISAVESAALTFSKGVYDLEIESPSGVVTKLLYGAVTVSKEATTT